MKKFTFLFVAFALLSLASYAQGEIKFETEEHDFGKIKEEDGPATHVFKFKNVGNAPVIISDVRASCGCTTPAWTKEPVQPGKTGSITAQYNPQGRPGIFNKTLTVTANTSPATTVVKIKGEVIPKPQP